MISFFIAFLLLFVPLGRIFLNTKKNQTSYSYPVVAIGVSIFYLIFLLFLNNFSPFSLGGDDFNYNQSSLIHFETIKDWFDTSLFVNFYAQAGYSILLAWLNQFVGDNLYIKKLLNFSFFLLISLYWYKIAFLMFGKKFATKTGVFFLFLTPLFYYSIILLKDMTIVLLQSYILYSLVLLNRTKNIFPIFIKISITVFFMISFRLPLAIFNILLIFVAIFIFDFRNKLTKSTVTLFSLILFVLVIYIGFSSPLLTKLGVSGEHRNLQTLTSEIKTEKYKENSTKNNKFAYLILFFLKEVSGFNYKTWDNLTYKSDIYHSLRGIFAIPWILFYFPMFIYGVYFVLKHRKLNNKLNNSIFKLIGVIFLGGYFFIGLASGDTTRWTISAVPAMALFSVYGFEHSSIRMKFISILSFAIVFCFFALYKLII